MRYEDNPFNILHVSMRDSQEKILDKVEDLSLTLDEALCSQASSILTNPTKRIEAEVSWFPGYTPKKIKEALEDAKATPDEFIDNFSEDELSYADVNAEILAFLNIPYPNMLKDYLLKIASDLENVDTDALFNELNKERNVAGIPAIPNIDILNTAVQNRKRDIAESIHIKLKKIDDIEKRIEILTYVVENDTSNGKIAPSSVIKDIIEKYEIDIQETLNYTASKVETLGTFVEMDLDRGDEAKIDESLQLYERQLKTWDRIAQPIQVLMQSQGLEHAASKEMAHSVRQLALKLYNEHGQLDASKRLINLMKTVFAEVLTVAEKTEEDTIILNGLSKGDEIFNKALGNCDKAVNDVKRVPRSGFSTAEQLLTEFEELLDASFKNRGNIDQHELTAITATSDIYINAMLVCIIEYGNATKEWEKCYDFIGKFSTYATKPETVKRINSNRYILSQNMKADPSNSYGINPFGCLGLVIAIVLLFVFMGSCGGPSRSSRNTSPQNTTQRHPVTKNPIPRKNVVTGYEDSHSYLNDDGLCEITIDNSKNNMPVYVRIWDTQERVPIRAFFIKQGESFTATELTPGRYEIRYRELYEDDTPPYGSKSETFSLTQRQTSTGTEYSTITLTLYKVQNGNTRTERINANDI